MFEITFFENMIRLDSNNKLKLDSDVYSKYSKAHQENTEQKVLDYKQPLLDTDTFNTKQDKYTNHDINLLSKANTASISNTNYSNRQLKSQSLMTSKTKSKTAKKS